MNSLLVFIRQEIEFLKDLNEGLYTEGDNSYYEGQDNACNHILAFIDSLPEETSGIYDTNKLTPTPSVNIEDVARVQFASHAHVFDRKRKAVFDWEQFKEVAGIFYGFGKRDSLPEDDPLNDPRFGDGFDAGRAVQRIFDEPEDDIPKIEGWIARNKDGSLVFCYHKPHRENSITQEWWGSCDADFRIYDDTIDEQFKDLKWEDEPREVELIFKCGICKESLQVQETCKENTDSFTNLEEAAEDLFETMEIQEHENIFEDTFKKIFIAGAKWMANQMLEREDRNDDKLPRFYGD